MKAEENPTAEYQIRSSREREEKMAHGAIFVHSLQPKTPSQHSGNAESFILNELFYASFICLTFSFSKKEEGSS
jgi:hypothetical protein